MNVKLITTCRQRATVLVKGGLWVGLSALSAISLSSISLSGSQVPRGFQDPVILGGEELPPPLVPPGQRDSVLSSNGEWQETDDYQVLTRGQLHEAFAEIVVQRPQMGELVPRQPPTPITELPPEYRPEGVNVEWISGYWAWEAERQDFVWISGVWREIPPGQRWVPGYWQESPEGYRWVSGFWVNEDLAEMSYLPEPPLSLERGPVQPAPSPDHFYSPGTWVYQTNDYVWQPGYWMPRLDNWVWIPPTYVWTPCGYVFRPGYWDRALEARGVVFAPVYFAQPVVPTFGFTPRCVIRTQLELLPHLFVNTRCNRYFFGDWYDNVGVNSSLFAWSTFGDQPQFATCYDPLFTYYSSPRIRYQNTVFINWARAESNRCFADVGIRPPRTFDPRWNDPRGTQFDRGDRDRGGRGGGWQLADSLERTIAERPNGPSNAPNFQRLSADERRIIKTGMRPQNDFAEQRKSRERELAVSESGGRNSGIAAPDRPARPEISKGEEVAGRRGNTSRGETNREPRGNRQQAEAVANRGLPKTIELPPSRRANANANDQVAEQNRERERGRPDRSGPTINDRQNRSVLKAATPEGAVAGSSTPEPSDRSSVRPPETLRPSAGRPTRASDPEQRAGSASARGRTADLNRPNEIDPNDVRGNRRGPIAGPSPAGGLVGGGPNGGISGTPGNAPDRSRDLQRAAAEQQRVLRQQAEAAQRVQRQTELQMRQDAERAARQQRDMQRQQASQQASQQAALERAQRQQAAQQNAQQAAQQRAQRQQETQQRLNNERTQRQQQQQSRQNERRERSGGGNRGGKDKK